MHGHDGIELGELTGQAQHFGTDGFNGFRNGEQLSGSFLDQQFCGLGLAYEGNDLSGFCVYLRGFVRVEVVAVAFAPFAVTFGKGCTTDGRNAFGMPEGRGKVNPLLTSVFAGRTVEPTIHWRRASNFQFEPRRSRSDLKSHRDFNLPERTGLTMQ